MVISTLRREQWGTETQHFVGIHLSLMGVCPEQRRHFASSHATADFTPEGLASPTIHRATNQIGEGILCGQQIGCNSNTTKPTNHQTTQPHVPCSTHFYAPSFSFSASAINKHRQTDKQVDIQLAPGGACPEAGGLVSRRSIPFPTRRKLKDKRQKPSPLFSLSLSLCRSCHAYLVASVPPGHAFVYARSSAAGKLGFRTDGGFVWFEYRTTRALAELQHSR